ncbi:MAG: arsenic-transporting ATPase [Promethearchaeota archaeon]|nr:MAG: arsenic-transporting ATPase [Candidatus Lokiarchaeota archaeon]
MNLKESLLNLSMIMFGGKGGVGKTTCAVSSAIWAAENGRNTMIISTDPAHSLGDSLGVHLIQGEPTPVPGVVNLTALEINPNINREEYRSLSNINPVEELGMPGIFESMPILDELQDLASTNVPGIDETLALLKVLEFIETDHEYDLIIFDTAPTGHTLRFLSLPETLSGWIGRLLKMRLKFGKMFGALKGLFSGDKKEDDKSLEVLERLNEAILHAREDLTDPNKNSFVIVMIPEEMAISETGRLINELVKYQISVSNVIVNQLYEEKNELCDFCKSRRIMQQKNMLVIKRVIEEGMGKNIIEVPLFREEVRKYVLLKRFGSYLIKETNF